jgi:hypothetical protein
MEKEIDFFRLNYKNEENLFQDLGKIFAEKNNLFIFDHRFDYSRWWTIITWQRLNEFNEEEIIEIFKKKILKLF